MLKIHCLSCINIDFSMSDGTECGYRYIDYLDDFIDIDLGFCDEYKYNHCISCNELEYIPEWHCAGCNKI